MCVATFLYSEWIHVKWLWKRNMLDRMKKKKKMNRTQSLLCMYKNLHIMYINIYRYMGSAVLTHSHIHIRTLTYIAMPENNMSFDYYYMNIGPIAHFWDSEASVCERAIFEMKMWKKQTTQIQFHNIELGFSYSYSFMAHVHTLTHE